MKIDTPSPSLSFRWLLFVVILVLILVTTGAVLAANYQSSTATLEDNRQTLQENTEYTLIQSMELVDRGLHLFDHSLDYKLKEPMDRFLMAYEESGGDPGKIDLKGLKADLGEEYELYIINDAGVVEYTTYPPDHLMDFSIYPQFFSRLTSIREGNIYVTDRITTEIQTGELRKFVYHPTPDNRYILEIGYMSDEVRDLRLGLRYTEIKQPVLEMNPYLTSIRIYNFLGEEVGNSSYAPLDARTRIITSVLETGETVVHEDPTTGSYTRFIFVDLSGIGNPPEMNLVAELAYTREPIQKELAHLLATHLGIAIVAVLFGGILAYGVTNRLARPIHRLVDDTDRIAGGDLDHPITPSRLPELRSLSFSLQSMVTHLKEMMQRLSASEEALKAKNEELEDTVLERTSELSDAHAQANFYLDIITHDIQNTNHTAQLALALLEEEVRGSTDVYIPQIRASLQKSDAIISRVSTLREIQERDEALQPIHIAPLLRSEADTHPEISLSMDDEDPVVLADPLISQAFANLIDNSLKFGGDGVAIWISVTGRDDWVMIQIDDTGPGIPDSHKNEIFGRYTRGSSWIRGKGLGLFIVKTLIVDRYGGSIRVEDRVPGDYTQGLSFIITLKKG
ncbi:HAMP domain-containing sensor histidine kinase [Methanocalculus natronophilus]|uniref:sensor histidine kinase n=1 Tax=Methanocalculus natronophilus TaxID=1262400 RepID=UPI0031B5B440